jgi:hypothetical protein
MLASRTSSRIPRTNWLSCFELLPQTSLDSRWQPELPHATSGTRIWTMKSSSHSQRYLTTDGQSVSLFWYQTAIRDPPPNFLSLSWNIFSVICGFHHLGRGWFCNLSVQLLLGFATAVILRSKSRRTRDHILLSHLRLCSSLWSTGKSS